ncbi:type VII toxin-antitoxin system MntA family adenylyltransferase antitoxin [Desulfolucanica intricata]|uniref:type VII toxin-antitoxin system MntA family adenylyltransferase antitoxin n=1 Tax=Desulfolucanica intricata TaxID=1285191 RepID=UPI00082FD9B3|nr:nucleotidyltransferase domain-containing protein [Desulfolucanica intricata]
MYRFKKIEHNVEEYIPLLAEKAKWDDDIIAMYLFGSYAEGKQTPVSDIDLAVLLDRDFSSKLYFEKKLDILSTTTSILKTDEVDLVILNQAPPALAYRVLCKGKLLYEKPEAKAQRVNFQVRTCDRYFDYKPVEKVIHEGLIRRIKEGRFGG